VSQAQRSLTVHTLDDLRAIRAELAARKAREAAEEAARVAALARREAQRNVFANAVGKVHPLPDRGRVVFEPELPPPIPVQHLLDEARVLLESISDDFDSSTLLDTDDNLSFRRPGVGCARANGPFSASSTCTACAPKAHAKPWEPLCANPPNKAFVACAWCMARAWVRSERRRCSRAGCRAG
jgi:hypothetical protein